MKTRELESFWQSTFVDGQFRESLENEKQKKRKTHFNLFTFLYHLVRINEKKTLCKKGKTTNLRKQKENCLECQKNHINVFNL